MSDIEPLYQCERCKEDYPEGSCYPLSQLGHAGTKDGPILCDYCMDDYRIENDGGGDPSSWYAVRDPREERIADLERQLAEREKTEQDLWEKLNCQDNEIDDLKRQLEEAQEKEKAAKDLISEVMFNHQSPDHPSYNGCEEGDCAWCGYARQSGLIDEGWFTVKDSTAGEPE